MFETFESSPKQFVFPDIQTEKGEFERVARTFNIDPDTLMFLAEEEGKMTQLTDTLWADLENSESYTIKKGDWDSVQKYAEEYKRDWIILKEKFESNIQVDAPMIIKYGAIYHLISGNTRLMVARAAGFIPEVLLFEYRHDRTNEKSS